MNSSHKTIGALGGTFDHFHKGHEHFLEFAAKQADQILIGITSQSLVKEKELSSNIDPYEIRSEAVRKYCEKKNIHFEIVELTDPFGPTLGQREVDSLIVTELTQRGGEMLNQRRAELKLDPLPVAVCSMVRDESGEILNSTRIRKGLVSREGIVYYKVFDNSYTLQPFQREFFKNPLGILVNKVELPSLTRLTAVVGDVCLSNFRKNNWQYQLGVFDKHSERQAVNDAEILSLVADATVKNPAGTIQSQTIQKLRELLQSIEVLGRSNPKHLYLEGEEDLVTAALILLMPLYSHIYYGQPERGMVQVWVSEELKARIHKLFSNVK